MLIPVRAGCILALSFACALAPTAVASADEHAPDTRGHYEDGVFIPGTREEAPNTDGCPQATRPPEPVSTSEASVAGPSPTPPPVAYTGPCGITAPPGFTIDASVLASAWLIADLDTGEIIAMKDPHGRYRPASIIKVLLALVAIDELPLDRVVTASPESAGQEGSRVGLVEGGSYSVNDLLHGLLLASGNDAAHALAQELGGDEETLAKVNALARRLGMDDTYVASYSGLDAPGMSSSAFDLGLAYREAFAHPVFADIVDTVFYDFPGHEDLPGFEVWNDNALYHEDPDGIGGKTGYTDDANHTFVGAVNHEGQRLVAVLLDTTADKARPWEQAQHLLHESYAFRGHAGVARLEPRAAAEPTPAPRPATPQAQQPPEQATVERSAPWRSLLIVAGVVVLAAVGVALSLGSQAKSGRRR
ncbi:D-alanyl-D-alanine carboxypeptidase family protein [Corynebacterium timonense]|uniref:D-alanyl-D-alanine carboxypeptidase family protein n=1 Tax=Corynebacterium timonense TaxID=441500 RepID=UPI000300B72A